MNIRSPMQHPLKYTLLIADENYVVNYEIKRLFQKNGFLIIEKTKQDDILDLLKTKSPDFTITCLALLLKAKIPADCINSIFQNNDLKGSSDTLILDNKRKLLVRYPKPFNPHDILNFIHNYLNINPNPKIKQHEINI